MPHHQVSNPPPEDLYACYLRFQAASQQQLLALAVSPGARRLISQERPMSRRAFARAMAALDPARRARLETLYRTPYQTVLARARGVIPQYFWGMIAQARRPVPKCQ